MPKPNDDYMDRLQRWIDHLNHLKAGPPGIQWEFVRIPQPLRFHSHPAVEYMNFSDVEIPELKPREPQPLKLEEIQFMIDCGIKPEEKL